MLYCTGPCGSEGTLRTLPTLFGEWWPNAACTNNSLWRHMRLIMSYTCHACRSVLKNSIHRWTIVDYSYIQCRPIISLFNHRDVFGQQSNRIRRKTQKGLLRRLRSLKVIEVGTSRKPVCDFPLVMNSNWHPISYRFRVIAAYCSNFEYFAFWAPLRGLGTMNMYDVHLQLMGKRVVDFILVLIELFR